MPVVRVSLSQELFYIYLFVDCVCVPLQMCESPETAWGSWFSSSPLQVPGSNSDDQAGQQTLLPTEPSR